VNDDALIEASKKIYEWAMEQGWDKEYGGILYFTDVFGFPPEPYEHDMKLWWPHTEALYATLLAFDVSGETKYEKWFDILHEYSFSHFADPAGEWFGYLHRDGTVSNTLKGSMWKGPFHLPRALLLCARKLDKMMGAAK
jgi:N-acylglucosamine 2-epimerase